MRTEEGLLLLNDKAHILWANPTAAELLGYSREELAQRVLPIVGEQSAQTDRVTTQRIQLPPYRLNAAGKVIEPAAAPMPPSRVGPVAKAFRAILAGEQLEAEGNARIPDKDDKRIAVHWRLWALPRVGRDVRILFSFSETAQASQEGPITSSYRDVFEYAVEGIYRTSMDGRFLEVNPALAKMCGYESPAEMVDRVQDLNTQYYVHPDRRDEFLIAIQQGGGSVASFESEVYRADGSVFWTAEFARVVSGGDGVPIYLEGGVIDISKRKRVEAALRESEEKFRGLVETTRVVPYEFHSAIKCFAYFGPQAESIFKSSLSPRLSLARWIRMLHPEDIREGTRFADPTLGNPRFDFQTEFRIRGAGGEIVWVRQVVHFEKSGPGNATVVRGFFIEVTDAKIRELELEQSRVQLRELANRLEQVREAERMSIAGEIHDDVGQSLTLLNLDLAWITKHLENPISEEGQKVLAHRVATMERHVETAFQTVRRLLLVLRPPLLEELGLKDAIDFHLAEFSKTAGLRHELVAFTSADLSMDTKIVVFRIFKELITNVIRHSKASRVDVQLYESGDNLVLVVSDNGCGLTDDKMKDPRKFGLLGIKERAFSLGGTVAFVGSIGKGTTVTLTIPLLRSVAIPVGVETLPAATQSP